MSEPREPVATPQEPPAGTPPPAGGAAAPGPPPGESPYGYRWRGDVYHPFDPRRKSPFLASFLSLMPGLGQIYVGYYQAGFIHTLVAGGIIVTLANGGARGLEPLLGFFLAFFWLYNIIDAGRRAAYYNQILEGDKGTTGLPTGFLAQGASGSIGGGVFLIAVGVILLSNTMLDFSLDWLEEWWPLAPVGFGVYLVFRGIADRIRLNEKD